jgi:hypothetical protein
MTTPFDDPLLTLVPTADIIELASRTDAYTLGVSAYLWGYPLVRMERVIREYTDLSEPQPATSYRGALNRLGWATELATPSAKDMPAANNDTLYLSGVVRLDEPYLLEVPDTEDRYYVINVFTMYHEIEHYIGRRVTGTGPGRFALVPPGWDGALPAGVRRLDVTTSKIWLWGRLHVRDGEPMEQVRRLQQQFRLTPLSGGPDVGSLAPMPEIAGDPLGFFHHLGHALGENRVPPYDAALFGQFERIGLTAAGFDPSGLSSGQREALARALEDAPKVAISAVAATAQNHQGWDWIAIDGYGFNYPLRAVHCGPYLGGNMVREAHYPSTYVDADGHPLTGEKRYRLEFPGEPPVDAFWSLTVYHADDKMLVENRLRRYKLGSESPELRRDPDGSFTLLLQHDEPASEQLANWLPVPAGGFFLVFRFYQPRPELIEGDYALPPVRPVTG